jgi:tRNA threonylcarbamoyladenosine modification (KEOPS) complex  Pcc1 subunit
LKLVANLSLEYESEAKAEIICQALEVDDGGRIELKASDKRIESKMRANSIPSLINTLEDFLACLSLAERVIGR